MNNHDFFPWFILLAPLFSAGIIQLFLRNNAKLSALISIAAVCFSFVGSIMLYLIPEPATANEIPWLDFGSAFHVPIGVTVDHLSKIMLLIVTGIGSLVHIYSTVYMDGDDGEGRFFGNLSLFMFSMIGIVLANNFVMMFIFWELVGVSSYLLVGHWHTRPAAAAAANKAFLTNRIGDFGFMLGILFIWGASGSVIFTEIQAKLPSLSITPTFLTITVLLIFCGAVGKSAQLPLHVWLPDAMEGPTPVSALIHAATMVAAGVYMLARVSFLIAPSPDAQNVIAIVGAATSLFAALIATQQDDIKRILAYSTLSQLGYMVMAIGLAAPGAAMFHLFTHAFFKALLFLGAGAVIHAVHHEQDIWKMGGLRTQMKWTFLTFAAGYLALIGFPGFSGFFSKDAILLAAYGRNVWLFVPGLLTAFLTAYYMTRMAVVVFFGKPRSDSAKHAHDGPAAMTLPLVILGILSLVAGWGTIEFFHAEQDEANAVFVQILAIGACLVGGFAGALFYWGQTKDPIVIPLLKNKFYVDELYAALIAGTQDLLASIAGWFDKWILDGLFVRGLSGTAWGTGFVLRFFQFGNLQAYAFLFGLGIVGMIFLLIFVH